MARFYVDEGFPKTVAQLLRDLSHDVLTVNRGDFIRLHLQNPDHAGIIVCTEDIDRARLASRIHAAVSLEERLVGKLIRVNRPNPL